MPPDDRFWSLIEGATPSEGAGTEEHAEAVTKALITLSSDDVIAFDAWLRGQLMRAYRWDLWAVAYIALGGCGDDGFEYFRLWLVAQGREYFDRALADPVRAADALEPGDEGECETLGYAASYVYEAVMAEELPYLSVPGAGDEPSGDAWSEEAVYELYPQLSERFDAI